jgi:hypothetical protein
VAVWAREDARYGAGSELPQADQLSGLGEELRRGSRSALVTVARTDQDLTHATATGRRGGRPQRARCRGELGRRKICAGHPDSPKTAPPRRFPSPRSWRRRSSIRRRCGACSINPRPLPSPAPLLPCFCPPGASTPAEANPRCPNSGWPRQKLALAKLWPTSMVDAASTASPKQR